MYCGFSLNLQPLRAPVSRLADAATELTNRGLDINASLPADLQASYAGLDQSGNAHIASLRRFQRPDWCCRAYNGHPLHHEFLL
jgi:hypothetical protein